MSSTKRKTLRGVGGLEGAGVGVPPGELPTPVLHGARHVLEDLLGVARHRDGCEIGVAGTLLCREGLARIRHVTASIRTEVERRHEYRRLARVRGDVVDRRDVPGSPAGDAEEPEHDDAQSGAQQCATAAGTSRGGPGEQQAQGTQYDGEQADQSTQKEDVEPDDGW